MGMMKVSPVLLCFNRIIIILWPPGAQRMCQECAEKNLTVVVLFNLALLILVGLHCVNCCKEAGCKSAEEHMVLGSD